MFRNILPKTIVKVYSNLNPLVKAGSLNHRSSVLSYLCFADTDKPKATFTEFQSLYTCCTAHATQPIF